MYIHIQYVCSNTHCRLNCDSFEHIGGINSHPQQILSRFLNFQTQVADGEVPTSPFQTSFSVTSETTPEGQTSVPPSATSSHRSSCNNKSKFSFFNANNVSRPPSSNTSSVHRRKASVRSVQVSRFVVGFYCRGL